MKTDREQILDWMVRLGCMTNEQVNHILTEATKRSVLMSNNPDIPEDVFDKIMSADPTGRENDKKHDKVGKRAKWLINLYKQDPTMLDRTEKIKVLLKGFNKNNFGGKDLEELAQNDEQLSELLNTSDNTKALSKDQQYAGDVKFNQDGWMIIVPSTFASSCYWAHIGTEHGAHPELRYEDGQWCTASPDSDSYYRKYTSYGLLYINIDTKNGKKYQLSFASMQYMDGDDYELDKINGQPILPNIPDSAVEWYRNNVEGAGVYQEITPEKAQEMLRNGADPMDVFDDVGDFREGFASVRLNGKRNFIDKNGNYLSEQWFDFVYCFDKGFAKVNLNGKWNFIDKNGNVLSEQWFDAPGYFHKGFAMVKLNGKYNWIDKNGNILSKQWFDWADSFSKGFAEVKLNDKYNFIDKNGNYLSEQWFDDVGGFCEGFAWVELNGKWNYIDENGNYLSEQWFDDTWSFEGGFGDVRLNGKWYQIDTEDICTSNKS